MQNTAPAQRPRFPQPRLPPAVEQRTEPAPPSSSAWAKTTQAPASSPSAAPATVPCWLRQRGRRPCHPSRLEQPPGSAGSQASSTDSSCRVLQDIVATKGSAVTPSADILWGGMMLRWWQGQVRRYFLVHPCFDHSQKTQHNWSLHSALIAWPRAFDQAS